MLSKSIEKIWKYLKRITTLSSEQIVEQLAIIILMDTNKKEEFLKKNKNYFEFEIDFMEAIKNSNERVLLSEFGFSFRIPTPNILWEILIDLNILEREYTKLEIFEEIYLKYSKEKQVKQYITPNYIIDLMIELAGEKENKKILDCFCGTGNILYSLLAEKNNNFNFSLEGMEVNEDVLKILFFRIFFKKASNISLIKGNYFEKKDVMSIDSFYQKRSMEMPDIIFAHPPFNLKVEYDFITMRGESALIYKVLDTLSDVGKAIIILPKSYLKSNLKEVKIIKDTLENTKVIEELIILPPKVFEDTAIETVILVLNKKNINKKIKFWNLEQEELKKLKSTEVLISRENLRCCGEGELIDFINDRIEFESKIIKKITLEKFRELNYFLLEENKSLECELVAELEEYIDIKESKEKKMRINIMEKLIKKQIQNLETIKKELKKSI